MKYAHFGAYTIRPYNITIAIVHNVFKSRFFRFCLTRTHTHTHTLIGAKPYYILHVRTILLLYTALYYSHLFFLLHTFIYFMNLRMHACRYVLYHIYYEYVFSFFNRWFSLEWHSQRFRVLYILNGLSWPRIYEMGNEAFRCVQADR